MMLAIAAQGCMLLSEMDFTIYLPFIIVTELQILFRKNGHERKRIYLGYFGVDRKQSHLRINVWHHEASLVILKIDLTIHLLFTANSHEIPLLLQ